LPRLGERLASGEADFDGANELGVVVGMDTRGGSGIEAAENAVQPRGTVLLRTMPEAFTEFLRSLRPGEEAVEKSAEVEAGAAGDDGEMLAGGDFCESLTSEAAVIACGTEVVGGQNINEVVRSEGAFGEGGLGGAEFHAAIDGDGIAIDDFAVEALREREGESSLATAGRPEQGDEEWLHRDWSQSSRSLSRRAQFGICYSTWSLAL
jgi:hypothetical protein